MNWPVKRERKTHMKENPTFSQTTAPLRPVVNQRQSDVQPQFAGWYQRLLMRTLTARLQTDIQRDSECDGTWQKPKEPLFGGRCEGLCLNSGIFILRGVVNLRGREIEKQRDYVCLWVWAKSKSLSFRGKSERLCSSLCMKRMKSEWAHWLVSSIGWI